MNELKTDKEPLPELKGYLRIFRLYISYKLIFSVLTALLAAGFVYAEALHPAVVRLIMRLQPVPRIIINSEYMDGYSGMARLIYSDGELIYRGRLEGGVVQGRGELFSDGKLLYSGEFSDGKFNGEGRLYHESGTLLYEGCFLENAYSGQGALFGTDGQKQYEGQFEKGSPNGSGTAYLDGGAVYEGDFVNGEYEGVGKLYCEGGLLYEGGFSGGVKNGAGKLYDPFHGELIYEGGFSGGLYSGQGREYSGGRLLYSGGFSDGLRDGAGKLYSAGGLVVYDGQWANDVYEGAGSLYEGLSLKYAGSFSNGRYNGDGIEYYPDTGYIKYEGRFIDGEYTASGIRYDEKGRALKIPPIKPYELLLTAYYDLIELLKDQQLEYREMELGGAPVVLVESAGWIFTATKDLKSAAPGFVSAVYYCGLDSVQGALVGMQRPDIVSALGAPQSEAGFTPAAPDILALTVSNSFWGRDAEADGVRGVRFKSESLYITVFFNDADKSLFFAVSAAPSGAKG